MHGATRVRTVPGPAATGRSAVVWIGPDRALVVCDAGAGRLDEAEVAVPEAADTRPLALAEVARHIGPVDRVLVLGPDDLRTDLERQIVAIGHAPDTIREAALEGPVDREVMLAKLRRLA